MVVENLMIYGSGGVAVTELQLDHETTVDFSAFGIPLFSINTQLSEQDTRWGWTAGAGMEWAFAEHWSFGAEYLYADFGRFSGTARGATNADPVFVETEIELTVQTVRAFLNFRL